MKFIEYVDPDGMGRQFVVYDKILQFSKSYGLTPIFDFRKKCYFRNAQYENQKASKYFKFDNSLIHDTNEIDKIKDDEIFKISRPNFEKYNVSESYSKMWYEYKSFNSTKKSKCFLDIVGFGLSEAKKQEYKNKVGIHLRLGNGEFTLNSTRRTIKTKFLTEESLLHLFKNFFESNKRSIFVCSDTKSIILKLKNSFGDLISSFDRYYPKIGWGAGHNTNLIPRQHRDKIDVYQSIYDAIYEMKLLGHTEQVFHTGGNFNWIAKNIYKLNCDLIDNLLK